MKKMTINSKELLMAVQTVGACVRPKNTMPILDNLLFRASRGRLSIIADNLEIRSRIDIGIDFDGELETCVPYRLLTDILRGLPNAPVDMAFKKSRLGITTASGHYNIPLMGWEEFPKPKEMEGQQGIKLNALEFTGALKKAMLFSERDSVTDFHNLLIDIGDRDVRIASTDGSVVYEYSMDAQGIPDRILISREVARYLVQTIDGEGDIEMEHSGTHLLLRLGNREIMARRSSGAFPDYRPLFDSLDPDKSLKIDRDSISPAIKRLYAITDKSSYTLVFDLRPDRLELAFTNDAKGYDAKETLECDYRGEDIRIGFNAHYMASMVSTLDEDIRMEFLHSERPCLFYAENTRALIAPIKL